MLILYNIGVFMYVGLVHLYSLFNAKARKWLHGRKAKNFYDIAPKIGKRILFHCASVGEFEQALPIIEKLVPSVDVVLSFFSVSGYEYAKKKHPELKTTYLPFDFKSQQVKFIEHINPDLVVIVKYEFWYHFIHQISQRQIPIFLVCGIFRKEQVFFKLYGGFFRSILHKFKYLFVQNAESKKLLEQFGIKHSEVLGDTRFDRVEYIKKMPFSDQTIETFLNDQPSFIGGSVWKSDEKALSHIIRTLPEHYKIILAPHEIKGYDASFLDEPPCLYSEPKNLNARVMILDTMGILSKIYRYADLTYVGGGYGAGLHNILEPAVYGNPVFIGKNFSKFNEALALHALGVAVNTSKPDEVNFFIKNWLTSEEFRNRIRTEISAFFAQNANVSDKISVFINKALQE